MFYLLLKSLTQLTQVRHTSAIKIKFYYRTSENIHTPSGPLPSSTRLLELLFVGWKEILSQNLTSFSPQLPHPPKSCPPTIGQKLRRQGLLGLHLFNSQFAYLMAHRKLLVVYQSQPEAVGVTLPTFSVGFPISVKFCKDRQDQGNSASPM